MKIGIDIDEVVAEFMPKFLEFYNNKFNKKYKKEDIFVYNLWEVFGGTKEDTIKLVDDFYDTKGYDEIELLENAGEIIKELSNKHEIFFITSRTLRFQQKTERFFDRHFPEMNFHLIYTSDLHDGNGKKKSEICKDIGIKAHVDDNKDYALEIAESGVKVLLLDKPWNQNHKEHKNIIKVKNWKEIAEIIKEIEKQ